MEPQTPKVATSPAIIRSVFSVILTGLVIGSIGSFLAVGFVEAIEFSWRTLREHQWPTGSGFNLLLIAIPVIGGLVVGQLVRLTQSKKPFNSAELILKLQTGRTEISVRDNLLTTLAAIVGMGTGASVGIYGALTLMGSGFGSNIARWLKWDKKLAIGCGIAAAISTAFSAPLAGLVFVHEVILRHYSLRAFAPVAVASSTGFFISNYLLQRPPVFQIEAERSIFAPEFFGFVVIGLVSAMVAIAFMRTVMIAEAIASRKYVPVWLHPAIAGLGIGILAQGVPEALGVGTELLGMVVLDHDFSTSRMIVMLVAKILASGLCLGFGYVGGVFSPSLVIGVLAGSLMGELGELVFGEMSSGAAVYAVCGMMAVTSPVIGGPLTAILIVFELTRNYELTTAVMISVVFSNVVAYRLFGRSLFDLQLKRDGVDLSHGRDKIMLQRTPISSYVTTDGVTVAAGTSPQEAQRAMQDAGRQECVVLDELSRYLGKLQLGKVMQIQQQDLQDQLPIEHYANKEALTLSHDQSVWHALQEMAEFVGECIPIVDQRGYYIGVVYEYALVAAYLKTTESLRAEENAPS